MLEYTSELRCPLLCMFVYIWEFIGSKGVKILARVHLLYLELISLGRYMEMIIDQCRIGN